MKEVLPLFLGLLEMKQKTQDRDQSTAWCKYDNFSEFYNSRKHMFAFQFSNDNGMFSAILRQFFTTQLIALDTYTSLGYDRLNDIVRPIVADNLDLFKYTLKDKWYVEYCDIIHRNE